MPVFAQAAACADPVARLVSYEGQVTARRAGAAPAVVAALDDAFCTGDVLEVGPYSRAALQLPDQTVLRIDQGSVITFAPPRDDKRTWLEVLRGLIHVISRDPRALRVTTPFANAGIEGTEFLVRVEDAATTVLVFEGRVTVENALGAATAGSGEAVVARSGSAPVLQVVVRPREQVAWTLYYPPTAAGALPAADAPGEGRDARFFVGRAEQRLAVGRIGEAEADLAAALALAPGDGEVYARQAVIALLRNDPDSAADLAGRAAAAAPASPAAALAGSYVAQARGDLDGARALLVAAADRHPGDALLKARLAELWLAGGDVPRAERAARDAIAIDPMLALGHAVLGFAGLARVDLPAAREAFGEAVRLDPGAPLPRLGLGLADIRDGRLAAGRGQIELAVILDPNNALVRSYMGKTYYAEKRDALAATQFGIARELDANDPTPWFYDAIRKQTVNRPVEALADLQASLRRNDNRAVYRSRLLLDEDLAARGAGRGRIYGDLGFAELALREGWASATVNPADFSGHRLLADSYAALPRHEIARVNELLQSQLLQPLNFTAVPPQLGEANLFILDAAGPASLAINEFNPLYSADGLQVQASGVGGNNGTWGNDLVVAGVAGRFSFSLGQFHFETDGFRENNDLTQDTLNALLQYQASPETSLLLEARFSDLEQGDTELLFDPENYFADERTEQQFTSVRAGVRHDFTARSTLLVLGYYQGGDSDFDLGTTFGLAQDLNQYSGELRYLYRGDRWTGTAGVRYGQRHADQVQTFEVFIPDDPPIVFADTIPASVRSDLFAAYAYTDLNLTPDLTLTLGASVDSIDGSVFDIDRVNPKLGLLWSITPATRLRLAAFRTVQGPGFSRQDIQPSLEPTFVGAFNQNFAGVESELARRYGIGLDHRFSDRTYAGIEASRRDVEFPLLESGAPPDFALTERRVDRDEDSVRAYLYATPTDRWALGVQYEYFKLEGPGADNFIEPSGAATLEANLFPVLARYIHPSGWSAGLTATGVHERGQFARLDLPPFPLVTRDSDQFVVFDAFVGYRLPRRMGLLRLEARNLFDEEIRFQDIDPANPRIYPERVVLGRFTVAFGR